MQNHNLQREREAKMKLNFYLTRLEIARETMEGLYRDKPSAEREAARAKAKFDIDYDIEEVKQSVQGRPAREFWKLIRKAS